MHSLVELYAADRCEIIGLIESNRVGGIKCLTAVVNFWSAKHGGEKYLGIRVYFIDTKFRYRSILVGTRHFAPSMVSMIKEFVVPSSDGLKYMLHPAVRHVGTLIDEVIAAVARTEGKMRDEAISAHVQAVRATIMKCLKNLMRSVVIGQAPEEPAQTAPIAAQTDLFDADIMATFAVRPTPTVSQYFRQPRSQNDSLIANELKKWEMDTGGLQMAASSPEPGKPSISKPECVFAILEAAA
ncbi:hypothetical protein PHYPSEUDO_006529 [Phytophthora pseudosyringae]|uniref:Uncharacterized protein n=1 Tax=Phytophthora pseudosyringae TaxID=221518 RepID=A0A8T1VIH9_9STRA|nr:hypothetical protein PHYPSEUDO_006529 [Phytophthora pseudosyringae]